MGRPPCMSTVDQDIVYCGFAQWIFSFLKAWDGGNFVFSHKVTLPFYHLLKKLDAYDVSIFWSFYMLIDN